MSGVRRFYPPTDSDLPMHGWRPYSDIHRERIRAHEKHDINGDSMERRPYDDESWLRVIIEELGEAYAELNEFRHGHITEAELMVRFRTELVQVAAMVVAQIDAIDLTLCDATHSTKLNPPSQHEVDRPGQPVDCSGPLFHQGQHVSWDGRTKW